MSSPVKLRLDADTWTGGVGQVALDSIAWSASPSPCSCCSAAIAFTASMPVALTGAGVSDPTIGLIVGSAAAVQVPAAFLAGALLDRFGGVRILYAGAIAYLLGSLIVLAPVTEPGDSTLPFFAARIFQGIGLAGTLP